MHRFELPPHLRKTSFTVMNSDAAGVPRERTRASDLIYVSRGIRVPTDAELKGSAALAAYTEVNPRSVLSHLSAAHLWGIPLPWGREEDWRIHLANPTAQRAPRRANVVGHRLNLRSGEIWLFNGVRLTSRARTWLDLAPSLSLNDLIAAGDFLVCSHGPEFPAPRTAHCTIEDLAQVIAHHPGVRGIRKARAALELIRVGSDSPPETFMRLALVEAGLPEPELNVVVKNEYGIAVLWPDGAYPDYKISLQYDGIHHNDSRQYEHDIERLETTKRMGWVEIRISRNDLRGDHPAVVQKIAAALRAKNWRPNSPHRGDM